MKIFGLKGWKEKLPDGILVHSVTLNTDAQSRARWEDSLSNEEFLSLSTKESCLNKRCLLLEIIETYKAEDVPNHPASRELFPLPKNTTTSKLFTLLEIEIHHDAMLRPINRNCASTT